MGTIRQIEIAQEECYCPVDVTMIPGAGHSPHREAPEATLNAIFGILPAAFCTSTRARRGGPPKRIGRGHAQMSVPPSNAAKLPLPQWAYVSRRNRRRPKPITIRYGRRWALVPSRFSRTSSRRGIRRLRYGIALNDAGYFWEAQEILEAGLGRRRRRADASGFCCGPCHPRSPNPQSQAFGCQKAACGGRRFFLARRVSELDTLGRNAINGRRWISSMLFPTGGAGGPPEGQNWRNRR